MTEDRVSNTEVADAFRECDSIVHTSDEDRWLAAHYAPPKLLRRLVALYALHVEIARAPKRAREPQLAQIRLQWWRDAVAEIAAGKRPRDHPVLVAASNANFITDEAATALDDAIEAQAAAPDGEPFRSGGEVEAWLLQFEAPFAQIALRLAVVSDPSAERAVADAAVARAMARLPGLAPTLDLRERAGELHRAAAPALSALPAAAMPAVAHFALTPAYLGRRPPSGARKRLALLRFAATGRMPH
jgi:phytoene synthase